MKEQLKNTINNSETYTLAVAEAMPEKNYGSKPVDAVYNFGELMNHIAYGIEWWTKNYIKKEEVPWNPPASKSGKKEAIVSLKDSYQFLKSSLNSGVVSEEKLNGLHATLDHITHHRGQATTYLRIKGITPPEYTY